MKPRPWRRCRAAFGPVALAAAAVLVLISAVPGLASGQSTTGWKRGLQRGDAPQGGHTGSGPARDGTAESGPRAPLLPERSGFYSNLGLLESISRQAVNAIADSLALASGSAVTLYASTPHEANWFVGNILGEILAERGYKVRILDWGRAAAAGDSSRPPPPLSAPAQPHRPRLTPKDGTAPADTATANPDSVQAEADSVQGDSEGGPSDKTSPADKQQGEEPPAPSEGQPASSSVPPAQGQALATTPPTFPAGEVLDLRLVEFGVSYADIGRKLLFGPLRFTRVAGVYLQVSSRREPEGELRQVLSAERHRVDRLSGSQRSLAEGASYPFKIPEPKVPGMGRYIEPTVVVGIVSSLVYLFYANQSSK